MTRLDSNSKAPQTYKSYLRQQGQDMLSEVQSLLPHDTPDTTVNINSVKPIPIDTAPLQTVLQRMQPIGAGQTDSQDYGPLGGFQGSILDKSGPLTQPFGNVNPGVEVMSRGVNSGADIGVNPGTHVALPPGKWVVLDSYSGDSRPGFIGDATNSGYGNSVFVQNAQTGERLRFSHLSQVDAAPGQVIDGNRVIGATGQTGNVTGPHLDLEYYNSGGKLADVMKSPYAKYLAPSVKGKGAGGKGGGNPFEALLGGAEKVATAPGQALLRLLNNPVSNYIKNAAQQTGSDIADYARYGIIPQSDPTLADKGQQAAENLAGMVMGGTPEMVSAPGDAASSLVSGAEKTSQDATTAVRNSMQNAAAQPGGFQAGFVGNTVDPLIEKYKAGGMTALTPPEKVSLMNNYTIEQLRELANNKPAGYFHDIESKTMQPAPPQIPLDSPFRQEPVGWDGAQNMVARERFNIPALQKIGAGSDRDVYDLGNGQVVKISKSARGLSQNDNEGDMYGPVPEVIERGKNYVITEKADKPNALTRNLVKEIRGNSYGGNTHISDIMNPLIEKYQNAGNEDVASILSDLTNFDPMIGDIGRIKNWGTDKNGLPILLDGGALNQSTLRNYEGTTNMADPEFKSAVMQSRTAKKAFGDTDNKTMYGFLAPLLGGAGAMAAMQRMQGGKTKD